MSDDDQEENIFSINIQLENYKHKEELKTEILDNLCPDNRLDYKNRLRDYIILEKLKEIKPGQYIRYFTINDKCQAGCALSKGGIVLCKKNESIVLKSIYGRKWTIKLEKCRYLFRKKNKTDQIIEVFLSMGLGNNNGLNIVKLERDDDDESDSEED